MTEQRLSMLKDDELRSLLARGEAVIFKGLSNEWQDIERQVERLGYGDAYIVALTSGPRGGGVTLSPCVARPSGS